MRSETLAATVAELIEQHPSSLGTVSACVCILACQCQRELSLMRELQANTHTVHAEHPPSVLLSPLIWFHAAFCLFIQHLPLYKASHHTLLFVSLPKAFTTVFYDVSLFSLCISCISLQPTYGGESLWMELTWFRAKNNRLFFFAAFKQHLVDN